MTREHLVAVVDRVGADEGAVQRSLRSLAEHGIHPEHIVVWGGAPAPGSSDTPWPWFDALDDATTGVLWVRAGTRLLDGSMPAFASALERFSRSDVLYGDAPGVARPAPSPVRLRTQDYLGPIRLFRSEALRRLGESTELDTLAAWDISLRIVADGGTLLHVGAPVGSMPTGPVARAEASAIRRVIEHHLRDIGIDGVVTVDERGVASIRYSIVGEPLVSVIIPTRGGKATVAGRERVLVVDAVRGIHERSTYNNVEFVIVADDDTPQDVVDALVDVCGDRITFVRWSGPFNFSGKMNRGAVHAKGDYFILLNDDVDVVSPDWIEALLGLAQQDGIGLVGALLFFEDGSIQHAGHTYDSGAPGHIAFGRYAAWDDALGSMQVEREVAGSTAACGMISAADFKAVGGFSTLFPGNYNDVDLCLKLRRAGQAVVWTPKARLYHFESKSRDARVAVSETMAIHRRWESHMQVDPFWPLGR